MNLQLGEPSANADPVKQRISEVSLSLKNLSYAISGMVGGEEPLDPDNMTHAMFAIHKQITALSKDLDELARVCETCAALQSSGEVYSSQTRCPACDGEIDAAGSSPSLSPVRR